jgi:hypothetical protein
MSDNRNRSAGARGVCSVDAGGLVTAPIRGQRRRGVPSLVLPGDPDGCGWFAIGGGEYVPFPSPPTGHPARERRTVRYVGRPTRWGNPYRVVKGRSGLLGVITPDERVVTLRTDCTAPEAARVAVRGFQHWLDHLDRSKPRAVLARHLAPLVTADVLSCWCPLDAPCHADTLCDLVGRLRSGVLVPGLVASPGVCGGALRIDGTRRLRGGQSSPSRSSGWTSGTEATRLTEDVATYRP